MTEFHAQNRSYMAEEEKWTLEDILSLHLCAHEHTETHTQISEYNEKKLFQDEKKIVQYITLLLLGCMLRV